MEFHTTHRLCAELCAGEELAPSSLGWQFLQAVSATGLSCFHPGGIWGMGNLFCLLLKCLIRNIDNLSCSHLFKGLISSTWASHLVPKHLSLFFCKTGTDNTINHWYHRCCDNEIRVTTMFWKNFQICVIITILLLDFLSPAHALYVSSHAEITTPF